MDVILEKLAAWEDKLEKESIPTEEKDWLLANPAYEEKPVSIRTFIDSTDYMNGSKECWESVKSDLESLFTGYDNPEGIWKYNEAVFDEGIGAGKSYKASVIIAYLVYRTLILKNPQEFFSLAKGSSIYFINMSVRSDQAKKIVFGEIAQRVSNSPWFMNRGYLPDKDIKSELRFPKNVNVIPGNSKETFPLGFNLLGGVMDEAAWYTDIDTHDVAEEIFNALHNRIKNRFGNKGMLIMISSPRYVDDFIEKKMLEAKINTSIFVIRHNSWEVKPKELFSGKTIEIDGFSIPVEYETEAKRNFDRFKRDYMAIPSLALEPYFKRWDLIEASIEDSLKHPILYGTVFCDWFIGNSLYEYFMHIDLSLVSDCTGISMCHRTEDNIVVDLMLKIRPPKGGEIDLAEIVQLVAELRRRKFNIKKCTFDQFQSASSVQELNKMGINSERLSVDKDLGPYETLKEVIYIGKLKMYRSQDLLNEMQRIELIDGKKCDHAARSEGKDLTDSLAGSVFNCVSDQNNFQFWTAGSSVKPKTDEQIKKESETLTVEGLVPYNYYRGRRAY